MGFLSLLKRAFICISVFLSAVILVILFAPGLPPHFQLTAFTITPPKKEYLDKLNRNNILDDAEVYYTGPYIGIESIIAMEDGSLIAADQSGSVFKVTGNEARINISQLQYPCEKFIYGPNAGKPENNCGWPLGIRLDTDGDILLMDIVGGLTKVNMKTGSVTNLVPGDMPIEGAVGLVPEDVDVAKDGTIYWTDGCTNADFFTEMIGQPSGRLLKFDRKSRQKTVLLKDLHMSNGLCLSDDESFVLVSETGSAKIRRYYLQGPKAGTSDDFVEGLPGYPDNIRGDGKGGFYVALFAVWNDEYSMSTDILSPLPLLRKFILRVKYILLGMISYVTPLVPQDSQVYLATLQEAVIQLRPILKFHKLPPNSVVVHLSSEGQVLQVLNGKSRKVPNLSQLTIGGKYAYMVGPYDNHIWRIPLSKLG